jgi:prophage tail gpP-like protein
LTVGGHVFNRWSSARITRDLRDIAGGFEVQYLDTGRAAAALNPNLDPLPPFQIIKGNMPCTVALDGIVRLTGAIDVVDVQRKAGSLVAKFTGRDATRNLIDCCASPPGTQPNGVTEWRNLDMLEIAKRICAPFGISVRADVDIGAAFPIFAINPDEKAMISLQKAARQRALLVVSDGIGGVILTRGGVTRAPAPLRCPGNVQDSSYTSDWTGRFSDYYVEGQTSRDLQRMNLDALMTQDTDPTTAPAPDAGTDATDDETTSTVMIGHAIDTQVTGYRPTTTLVYTQSGSSSVQDQAAWALRVARGMGESLNYTVLDWRAGDGNDPWLTNQVVRVTDPYADIDGDMLISGTEQNISAAGVMTTLKIAGRTAFDRIDEPADSGTDA